MKASFCIQLMKRLDQPLRPFSFNEHTKSITIVELTVPMETQINHWHETKTATNAAIYAAASQTMAFYAVEVGCRGLIPESAINFMKEIGLSKKRIKETAGLLTLPH